ncbi:MAG: hypothetical protein OXH14_07525, partial [Alphaproteobacteria bacterium]|nr:hypothetical protein [Alphaproteobacteria bacterium]
MATNITEEHRRAPDALKSGRYDNFCLFSCYVDREPAAAIAALSVPEPDGGSETEYGINPLFVSVTPATRLAHRHGCRMTACHGGWYALARMMDHPAVRWRHDETFYSDPGETLMALRQDGTVTHLMYHEGTHMLARDLGFMNAPALRGWTERHAEIWGNRHGERMFAGDGAVAFDKPPFTPVMVSEIVAWWRAVADRLDGAIPA